MSLLDRLPHAPPIRCLDRALEPREGVARSEQRVVEGPLLDGDALWSGALVEGMAQTAALLGSGADEPPEEGGEPVRGFLVGVRRLQISRAPRLGETVTYEVRSRVRLGLGLSVDARALVGEEEVAAGRLSFVIQRGPA